MAYSKAQVTIDLDEYNELKRKEALLKKDKEDMQRTLDQYWGALSQISQPLRMSMYDPQLRAAEVLRKFPYTPSKQVI